MAGNVVRIRILGDAKGLKNATDDAGDAIGKLENRSMNLSRVLAVAFSAGVVVRFAADTVKAASDIEESLNKLNVLLGESQPEVVKWASTVATSFGISRRTALETAGTFANLFEKLDRTQPEIAQMSKGMVELAADMASFNNTTVDDALTALMAGLRGESMPLRRFGVLLDEATLKERAMSLGLRDTTTGVLPPLIRLQASYAEILSQTTKQQGDFTRTSSSTANQTKTLAAEVDDLKVAIGERLTPVAKNFIRVAREWVPTFTAVGDQIVGMAKASGVLSTEFAAATLAAGGFVAALSAQQGALRLTNTALEGLGKSAIAIRTPWLMVGAALATVAATAYLKIQKANVDAAKAVDTLSEALANSKDPLGVAVQQMKELAEELERVGGDTASAADQVTRFDENWAAGIAQRDASIDQFAKIGAGAKQILELGRDAGDELNAAWTAATKTLTQGGNVISTDATQQLKDFEVAVGQIDTATGRFVYRLFESQAAGKLTNDELKAMLATLMNVSDAFAGTKKQLEEEVTARLQVARATGVVTQAWLDEKNAKYASLNPTERLINLSNDLKAAYDIQKRKTEEAAKSAYQYAKDHGSAAERTRILRGEIEELIEAYDKEQEALLSSVDADFALESAQRRTLRSQRDLDKKTRELAEAQNEYAEGSDELVAAQEAVEDATESLIDASRREAEGVLKAMKGRVESGEAAFTAAEMTDAYVAKLRELRDRATDPTVKAALDEIIGRFDRNATAAGTAASNIREMEEALKRIARNEKVSAFAELGLVAPPEAPSPPGRAAGGPVSANRPYVVGEAGPELFVPQRSGSIIPNSQLGGGQVTINIMTPIGRPDDVVRWVREELRKLDRGQR